MDYTRYGPERLVVVRMKRWIFGKCRSQEKIWKQKLYPELLNICPQFHQKDCKGKNLWIMASHCSFHFTSGPGSGQHVLMLECHLADSQSNLHPYKSSPAPLLQQQKSFSKRLTLMLSTCQLPTFQDICSFLQSAVFCHSYYLVSVFFFNIFSSIHC